MRGECGSHGGDRRNPSGCPCRSEDNGHGAQCHGCRGQGQLRQADLACPPIHGCCSGPVVTLDLTSDPHIDVGLDVGDRGKSALAVDESADVADQSDASAVTRSARSSNTSAASASW